MARKLYYKIVDDGRNSITDQEWDEILRLQHWYNSEFNWTAGKLGFKMYVVFPNLDRVGQDENTLWVNIHQRRVELRNQGFMDNQVILQLETEDLIHVKKGGYLDGCLASGFTRVAGNEFNAYLTCEYLLKASRIARYADIEVIDEGEFIKSGKIKYHSGKVLLPMDTISNRAYYETLIDHHHVFATVDAAKYDRFPVFKNTITHFNDLTKDEQRIILHDWNWLGFENNFDLNGDDIQGYDLNKKVVSINIENIQNTA